MRTKTTMVGALVAMHVGLAVFQALAQKIQCISMVAL